MVDSTGFKPVSLRQSAAEVRPIPGHPGYFASTDGVIYTAVNRRIMRPMSPVRGGKDGAYRYVALGKSFRAGVHQLVALAFLPKPPMVKPGQRLVVAHWDNDPQNNDVSNLRWATQSENLRDRYRHGTAPLGEKNHASKITADVVADIRRRREAGDTCRAIAADTGLCPQQVHRIGRGERWQHLPLAGAL